MVTRYSLRKNINYMAMAFWRPQWAIDQLLRETSPLYGVLPFLLYLLAGEVCNFLAATQGLSPNPSSNPFPTLVPFQEANYYYTKLILFPLLCIVSLVIFTGAIYLLSRLSWFRDVSTTRCTFFLMFLSTIGIVILICESPWMPFAIQFYAPPIGGLICAVYLIEFIHEQAKISRIGSTVISILSLTAYFAFRGVTMAVQRSVRRRGATRSPSSAASPNGAPNLNRMRLS